MKVQYLTSQIDHSREYLDQVKTIDGQLRDLLKYKNDKGILHNETLLGVTATGGPMTQDQKDIEQTLDEKNPDLSWERIINKVGSFKQEARARLNSYEDLSHWINMQRKQFTATPRGWPCLGEISSHYGLRESPFGGDQEEYHPGIDISGTRGAPIRATADGIVRIASWRSGYGNLVVLQHDFGFSTRYGHNTKILVKVGDRVKRGQTVALMGDTGRASGVHCHYEVWRYSNRMNPLAYLKDETGTATAAKPSKVENPAS
jgi:murein DD-endopeptidase MepM/ murein hydrolase activator NlpD